MSAHGRVERERDGGPSGRRGPPRRAAGAPAWLAGALAAALAGALGALPAARADSGERDATRARALVDELCRGPSEPARRALYDLGQPGLEALAAALARVDDPAAWLRLERAFGEALGGRLADLDRRLGELEQARARAEPGASIPVLEGEGQAAVEALEREVRAAGYAAAAQLAAPAPGSDELARLARQALLDDLAAALAREAAAARAAGGLPALTERLERLGARVVPLIRALAASPSAEAAAFAEAVRAAQAQGAIARLADPDPAARALAAERLFALGALARADLEALAASADALPHASWTAKLLLQRIRWRISEALYARTGDLLYGFEALPWKARRLRAFELEKQGGAEAIPTLRAILEQDPSDEVRFLAAESLARLGDLTGFAYLAGLGRSFIRQSPEVLAAIAMDQGIRYLQIRRFDKAVVEFERVLELDPENDVALYNLACTYALMGATDRALDFLERSVKAGFDNVAHILKDSDLESLRAHPRFLDLVRRLREAEDEGGGGPHR